VKYVLEVISLDGLFRVKQLQKFLHKLWSHKDLQLTNFNRLVDHELKEEFINSLQVRPGWINLLFLINTRLRQRKVRLLDVWQGSENVLLNHLHDLLNVRDDELGNILLVSEHLLQLLYGVESLSLNAG
jgi:hypothetical protein